MIEFIRKRIAMIRWFGLSFRTMGFMLFLRIVSMMLEAAAIVVLVPIFEILRAGGSVDNAALKGRYWEILHELSAQTGIPISLGLLLAISFAFIILRQFANYYTARNENLVKKRVKVRFQEKALAAYLRTSTALQDRSLVSEITNNLTQQLGAALSSLFAIVNALGRVLQVSIYVGGLLLLSVPTTLLSFVLIGVAVFFGRDLLAEIKRAGMAITNISAQLTTFMVDRLKHTRLIRLSGTEKAEALAFGKIARQLADEGLRQELAAAKASLLPEPFMLGFGYLMLFIGAAVFGLPLGTLGLFVIILIRLLPIVKGMITDYNKIVGRWPPAERLYRYLTEIQAAREPAGGNKNFTRLDQGIDYRQVSFKYHAQHVPALLDVTVKIPAHRMTALVGPSGAGKSTFVDLLPRLRDPDAGQILFDNIPINEFTTSSLRAGISFVPQQPQIFNTSAAEHIRYGKEDATDDQVREAARLAGALPFIEALPEGFDTPLGDGGRRLSGGQRQRLDIARALVRRAPILILDEPTSALDADAEAAFRDALQTLRRETDLTIIVIAHRLSTIADADHIVVLREGRVDAAGTHDELVRGNNWYARAFATQLSALFSPTAEVAEPERMP